MANKLSQLFDRQRFQQNPRLAKVIGEVESRYASALSDDELELVSAAGEVHAHPAAESPAVPPTILGRGSRREDDKIGN